MYRSWYARGMVAVFMCALLSHVSDAALLRNSVTVSSNVVRLSDLFTGVDATQDQVLGPAPPPGVTVYVGGRQLIAIADEYGVDWLDQSSTAQVRMTRAARLLDRDYFVRLLQEHLPALQDSPGIVDFDDFHPFFVAADDRNPVSITDINWDKRSSHFTATIYRTHPTGDVTKDSFLLRGFVRPALPILVFTHPMAAGSAITAGDVRLDSSYDRAQTGLKPFTSEQEVDGMLLVRNVEEGKPVLRRDLQKHVVIQKGDPVLMSYSVPGLRLTATGRALEDGSRGQVIQVLNVGNKMILTGRVTNSSEVSIDTTSSPTPMGARLPRNMSVTTRVGHPSGFSRQE